jgi:orotidine-5'-phosphate decarboxylase
LFVSVETPSASPIIFALDFATVDEARDEARVVASAVGMLKVGLELYVHAGPAVVELGRDAGLPVFLDLKLHDIPETVERAVASAAKLGARALTVHASGGTKMLARAVERAANTGMEICAVTVLTSLDDHDAQAIGFSASASRTAVGLANLAWEAGVRWFVCSPAEVSTLRDTLGPQATLVTPGVRPASAALGDQKRVATPADAIRAGANWLVVGRPIRDAEDSLAAARAITNEALAAR